MGDVRFQKSDDVALMTDMRAHSRLTANFGIGNVLVRRAAPPMVVGLHALHLAEHGYITITADAAYQGGSGGEPRSVDKPTSRIEDIHGMADFITSYPGVDAARLGLFGICGGGGYSLAVAKTDKRFKSVATLSMFNSGRVRRNGYEDSQLATIQERLRQASAQAEKLSIRAMPI